MSTNTDFSKLLDAAVSEPEHEPVFEQVISHMGLTARPQQAKLVEHARQAVADDSQKFVQAGTGVGKSYAILSVALEAARANSMPSVVVCPTNALVTQYVEKDTPRVAEAALGVFEYLKGRSHYLCTSSYGAQKEFGSEDQRDAAFLKAIENGDYEWAQHNLDSRWGCTGDCERCRCASRAGGCACAVNRCCTRELTAGKCCCRRCNGDLCGVQLARARAQEADVVVTNGHVLVWDFRVRSFTQGQSGILPEYGSLFVDECHELEAVGRNCYSDQITPGSSVYDEVPGLRPWVMQAVKDVDERAELELGTVVSIGPLEDDIAESLRRVNEIKSLLEATFDKTLRKEYNKELNALNRFLGFVNIEDPQFVSTITMEWSEKEQEALPMLNHKCVDVSSEFRTILTRQSALLASGTVPQTLGRRLGIGEAPLSDVGSPFDYSKSVLMFSNLSGKFGMNNDYERACQVVDAINAAYTKGVDGEQGGTLVLFSSWRDFENVMEIVVPRLADGIPVFAQSRTDQRDTAQMIEEFRNHGKAVLCGVQSLWTGIDIPGSALKQVIIYKVPYPVPTIESKAIEAVHGRQVYTDNMMQLLVQGIGRLIRTTSDSGRVFIVDSRARTLRWSSNPMSKHIAQFKQPR